MDRAICRLLDDDGIGEIRFRLHGQLPGGKNAVQVTRTGHRYPNARFVAWRTAVLKQLKAQCAEVRPISTPCRLIVDYYSGDKRRRDIPGMLDALLHLCERGQLVADD